MSQRKLFLPDDRAVSTTVGYVIALVITAVLISGLLTAGGAFLDGQRDQVAREEMTVIGERTAAGVVDADRLASTSDGQGTVYLRVSLPRQIAGATYAVGVNNTTAPGAAASQPYAYDLVLRSNSIGIRETVPVRLHHELRVQAVTGGDVVVAFVDTDGDGRGELELRKAIDVPEPAEPVLLSHIEVAYVTPGGQLSTTSNDSAPTRYAIPTDVGIIGPKKADFDGDGVREVPYVNVSGGVNTVNANNETTTTAATNAKDTDARVSVGRWQGSPLSVFYVRAGTNTVYRVVPGEDPVQVWDLTNNGGYGISSPAGFGDIDGDGASEFVYADGSQQLRYVDDDGTTEIKITNGGAGAGNSPGIGDPQDFDGDGEARVPFVDGSSNVKLINADGTSVQIASGADKALVSSVDVDADGSQEVVYLDNGDLYYIDDVAGANTVKQLTTDTGAAVEADNDMGAV
jgi:hypothetical protein